ncbi:hypothetical protein [Natranaerobius trueperi]|uniref:Uncharacterized protein n=1 Tax=Natranaerobius trueperi TaxID=759412 RepID=A0A226C036_9FIRM|nr:hypothetical protein [Natranaerobius trueperi]OWZ84541.1 hypothetical protein CDO51_03310 [Natranaerobius trueperi]
MSSKYEKYHNKQQDTEEIDKLEREIKEDLKLGDEEVDIARQLFKISPPSPDPKFQQELKIKLLQEHRSLNNKSKKKLFNLPLGGGYSRAIGGLAAAFLAGILIYSFSFGSTTEETPQSFEISKVEEETENNARNEEQPTYSSDELDTKTQDKTLPEIKDDFNEEESQDVETENSGEEQKSYSDISQASSDEPNILKRSEKDNDDKLSNFISNLDNRLPIYDIDINYVNENELENTLKNIKESEDLNKHKAFDYVNNLVQYYEKNHTSLNPIYIGSETNGETKLFHFKINSTLKKNEYSPIIIYDQQDFIKITSKGEITKAHLNILEDISFVEKKDIKTEKELLEKTKYSNYQPNLGYKQSEDVFLVPVLFNFENDLINIESMISLLP